MPTIVITSMTRYIYFQWLLCGLYELENKGIIRLRFKSLSLYERLSLFFNNKYVNAGFLYVVKKIKLSKKWLYKDSYCLDGYIDYQDRRYSFCVDCADSPFLFSAERLKNVDVYFKIQCPINLQGDGFQLTDKVLIPWCDHEHIDPGLELTDFGERRVIEDFQDFSEKIRPFMIGVRQMAWGNSRKALRASYNNLLQSRNVGKQKTLMCYFGNSRGPVPNNKAVIDYDKESSIVNCFYERISHPNEKRAIASAILNKMGDGYDGRVINQGASDAKGVKDKSLVVPLEEFSSFVAQFEYNLNISGYRLSIPSRFIDSFICGTAIVTDKLSVKWYKPFGKSVVETVEMGYLPNDEVDWAQFEYDLKHLPIVSSNDVIKEYEENWAPEPVAKYFLSSIIPGLQL